MDFLSDEELAYWLAFDQLNGAGLGASKVRTICERLGSAERGWKASKSMLKYIEGLTEQVIDKFLARRQEVNPELLTDKLHAAGVTAYPYIHPYYPGLLREIHDPPLIIYAKGDLIPNDLPTPVSIVGTRRPSSYGQRLAKEFAHKLASCGATVISGMAIGIDSLAHRGAIEGGGKTVAVLGCGPDVCYPSSNRPLYKLLVEGGLGAVLSEFPPGTRPETWRFPARNRIISGLSKAVVVIEAGERSGALITARLAFDQNREVFAVPGRIDSPQSAGTNSLIAKNTAHLAGSFEDILEEMTWIKGTASTEVPTMVELYGREKDIFDILSHEPMHFDHICERAAMQVGELSATLTMLELAGAVTRHPGDWYSRET